MAKASDKYRNWFHSEKLVSDLMDEAADDIDERDAEIERLRESLQLCVEAIGEWEKDPNSKDQYLPRIMFRALRLAQSALQQKDTK